MKTRASSRRRSPGPSPSVVCVAHPDDESIFFGGLLLSRPRKNWKVICVTDANADGQGKKRKAQFQKACEALGVRSFEWWGYPDIYEKRLPVAEIESRLRQLPWPKDIFTHGIIGEYGHPHHQDVSCAVHRAFGDHPRLYSVAYNSYPELKVSLTREQYQKKAEILIHIYGSETSRFLNLLPATFTEGFHRLDPAEIAALYSYFSGGASLKEKSLKRYSWLKDFLKQNRARARPF